MRVKIFVSVCLLLAGVVWVFISRNSKSSSNSDPVQPTQYTKDTENLFQINSETGNIAITNNYYSERNQATQESVKEIRQLLDSADQRLNSLESREHLDDLVTAIFERAKVEKFIHTDHERLVIIPREETWAYLIFVLEHVPIPQTIELKYHNLSQPNGSFSAYKNIVLFNWNDSIGMTLSRA